MTSKQIETCPSVWSNHFRRAVTENKKVCHLSPAYKKKKREPNPETRKLNRVERWLSSRRLLRTLCVDIGAWHGTFEVAP